MVRRRASRARVRSADPGSSGIGEFATSWPLVTPQLPGNDYTPKLPANYVNAAEVPDVRTIHPVLTIIDGKVVYDTLGR